MRRSSWRSSPAVFPPNLGRKWLLTSCRNRSPRRRRWVNGLKIFPGRGHRDFLARLADRERWPPSSLQNWVHFLAAMLVEEADPGHCEHAAVRYGLVRCREGRDEAALLREFLELGVVQAVGRGQKIDMDGERLLHLLSPVT